MTVTGAVQYLNLDRARVCAAVDHGEDGIAQHPIGLDGCRVLRLLDGVKIDDISRLRTEVPAAHATELRAARIGHVDRDALVQGTARRTDRHGRIFVLARELPLPVLVTKPRRAQHENSLHFRRRVCRRRDQRGRKFLRRHRLPTLPDRVGHRPKLSQSEVGRYFDLPHGVLDETRESGWPRNAND
ncbi:hypothetical protein ACVWY2_006566 [Bradyrhizobium sp. JR6.1]